jgi:hypothetical protein
MKRWETSNSALPLSLSGNRSWKRNEILDEDAQFLSFLVEL